MANETVGFIGLGLMGHGMAKNIVEKGWPLVVAGRRNRKPIEDLAARGAKEAKTPREVGEQATVVFLCVTGSPEVEAVVRGPDGLKAGMKPGSVIVDCSTSDPVSTVALYEELKAAGIELVDAPLSRTPKEAWEGKLDTVSHAELARTKLFRNATEHGKISLLQSTDSFYAAVDKSAQRIIVDRLWEETKTAPEFELPDDALCAFDAAWVTRAFHGSLESPCHYTVEMASCPTPASAVPPKGFTLEDDNNPCYTVRPTKTIAKQN